MTDRTRLAWTTGGVAGGFAIGGVAFRSDAFYEWLQGANWADLPSTIVGTGIVAAAAGYAAHQLSKRSVKSLRLSELEADAEFDRKERSKSHADREARRQAWDAFHDLCKLANERSDTHASFLKAAADQAQELDVAEFERVQLANANRPRDSREKAKAIRFAVEDAAQCLAVRPIELRSVLPTIVTGLRALVDENEVAVLRVPLDALVGFQQLLADDANWLPVDVRVVIDAVTDASAGNRRRSMIQVVQTTSELVRALERLAWTYCSRPHDADEVDGYARPWGTGNPIDVPAIAARLIDQIGAIGAAEE